MDHQPQSREARRPRPLLLAATAAVAAAAAFATYAVVNAVGVSGETSVAQSVSPALADADPLVDPGSVDEALAEPEPVLPEGMPTGRPDQIGKPLDPLSPEEIGYARALSVSEQRKEGQRVDGTPGYQFISAELAPGAESAASRVVQVLSFDYASDEAVTQMVDLRAGTVKESRTTGLQPPPSKRESAYAMNLLVKSPAGADLRKTYQEATGKELTSADQLFFRAGTYTSGGGTSADQCGVHRCLTFQGLTDSGGWLYFGNLAADLSDGVVRSIAQR